MANPNRDGWDWPYILYVGRKWLGYTEEQLWKLTPRQFYAQLSVHEDVTKKLNGVGSTQAATGEHRAADVGYIDQIPGW